MNITKLEIYDEQQVAELTAGRKDGELRLSPFLDGHGVYIDGQSTDEFSYALTLSLSWEELDILVEKLKEWREQNAKPDEPEEGNAG